MPTDTTATNSLFVDTSGWADPVLRNTADHDAMEAAYKEIVASDRPLITTNYVVAELVALLTARSRATRPQILALINGIKRLPQLRVIYIDENTDDAAWEMLECSPDKDWSLCDAASFVLMRELGITEAFTSDHHFDQAAFLKNPAIVADASLPYRSSRMICRVRESGWHSRRAMPGCVISLYYVVHMLVSGKSARRLHTSAAQAYT